MTAHLRRARESIQRASESVDGETRENLLSLDEALGSLIEQTVETGDPDDAADRFEEIEEKVEGLLDEVDGGTETTLQEARDHLNSYRREHDFS